MSKNDFNQGIQVGLSISEELLNKEAKAMDYLKDKIDGMSLAQEEVKNAVNNILEFHTKDALEKYYGICNSISPKDLEEPERKVLLDVLSTLAFQIDNFNKAQKIYLSNLKHYLGLTEYNPNVNYDLELIENIRDLDSQEIILKCVREFMFLENEDFSFVEVIEDILDYFSIKAKIIRKIDDCISITHYLFGKDGVIEMYGNHSFEDLSEDEAEEAINLELEQLRLKDDIVVNKDETREFKNKVIDIKCKIECHGKLVFENCKLTYDRRETIAMYDNSSIEIKNCFIKGIVKDEGWKYFISSEGSGVNYSITNSIIKDSIFLLEMGWSSECHITSCEISDCINLLKFGECTDLYGTANKNIAVLKNCLINIEEEYDYLCGADRWIISGNGIDVINCEFERVKKIDDSSNSKKKISDIEIIQGSVNKLYNCTIKKTEERLYVKDAQLCRFTACQHVLGNIGLITDSEIKDCTFDKCRDVISNGRNVIVRGCQFIECEEEIMGLYDNSRVDNCEFYNIKNEGRGLFGASIIAWLHDDKYASSHISNCVFKGVNINGGWNACLVRANTSLKIDTPILYMEDCKMENAKITSKCGKAVMDTYTYNGMFNKTYTKKGISCSNCTGFDNISHADGIYNDYVINEKNKNGERIGCGDEIKVGVAGKIANCIAKGLVTVVS